MKHSPKLAILQSLDAMDQVQMEQVLLYVKELLARNEVMHHRTLKSKAMREIRKALQTGKRKRLPVRA